MKSIVKKRVGTILVLTLLSAGVFAVPAEIIYENVKELVVDELKKNSINTAVTVASFIETDINSYKEITKVNDYKKGTYDEVYYEEMLTIFNNIKQKTGATFVFSEKKLSDDKIAYIFDGEKPGSENFSAIGSSDSMGTVELNVFRTGKADATNMIEDPFWGEFITGFAPIVDRNSGEVVGLVGVDFAIEYVEALLRNIQKIIMLSFFVVMILSTAIIYIILDLKYKAFEKDYLTDLFSKGYHEQQLKKIIDHARWTGFPLSLVMIDIDDFKKINDNYGHVAGDEILKSISKTIKENLRHGDVCSRYGGDELIIILPGTEEKEALNICERIRAVTGENEFQLADGNVVGITLSIGIAKWNPKLNADDFVMKADKAMYISKNTGKNKISIAEEEKSEEI